MVCILHIKTVLYVVRVTQVVVGLVCTLGFEPFIAEKTHTPHLPRLLSWCFIMGPSVALYIMGFTLKFSCLEEQQLPANDSSFAVRGEEGGVLSPGKKKNLAPKAGASSVLNAAICSVAKGLWALSMPGNVRFFFFRAWLP